MKKTEEDFDAVLMMRRIRDEMSEEIAGMSFDEQKRYLREGERRARSVKMGTK